MSLSTIAVTGGDGKVGRAILENLATHSYETVNISRGKQREEVSDTYVTTDLLDAGQTYGALAMSDPDTVVHMGTIPNPYSHQEYRAYKSNTMSVMHLLEASEALSLESCRLASSINAMGAEHQVRPPQVDYLPIDEAHPRTPDDVYGIAKHAMEITADGFGRRPDSNVTISTSRYLWVPDEQEVIENALLNRGRA
jgi:nucleoside-diphosphate-sugar epimerase